MREKILLIDGNSIINRAFFAIPVLTNSFNEYTNAVYGFLNIYFKLFDEEAPDYAAVAFDLPKPTFRHEKYGAYKGTRKSMSDELRPQLPLLKGLLSKMNIKIFEMEGYEADDILGTLAAQAEIQGLRSVIISGDKDLLQLASDNVMIRIPKTRNGKTEIEDFDGKGVYDKIGVTPKQFIDVKALMGDTSDNIPGVPGIGEKTAVKIIQEYGSVENAINHAADIKPKKASESLAANSELAVISKFLATIITDVPLKLNITEASAGFMYNKDSLDEIKRLEFKSYISRFSSECDSSEVLLANPVSGGYDVISNEPDIREYIKKLSESDLAAFYIAYTDSLLGISIKIAGQKPVFLKNVKNADSFMSVCREFFESDIKKLSVDSKKDMSLAEKHGIVIKNIIVDGLLWGYIKNSSNSSYECSDIARELLNESHPSYDEIFIKNKSRSGKNAVEITMEQELSFICSQADILYRAYPLMEEFLETNGLKSLYRDIELPFAEVLKDMENVGIKLSEETLKEYGKGLQEHIDGLTRDIYALAGEEFNINSPIQLGAIIFDKLKLKGTKKTKQGWSTAADVLEKLYDKHEIIPLIMEYRTYTKLKSTYVDGLLSLQDDKTGKIYSTFSQTSTSTGRISSSEPNLQNIPIRLELGRLLRKAFVPSSDEYIFLDGDYSQIELRVLAHMSGDEILIQAFREGQDIHRLTASQVFNIPFDQVTEAQRRGAKAVNFGIVYGISAYSLSQDLGIPVYEAQRYIDGYFEKYPKVKEYLDNTVKQARQDGYASTIFNRMRSIPEINSSNHVTRSFGERVAMNMPIQGSAADIIKIAMIRIHRRLKEHGFGSRIILQVHDELLIEVKKDELDAIRDVVRNEMENAAQLSVPLETDFHLGDNWYDAK